VPDILHLLPCEDRVNGQLSSQQGKRVETVTETLATRPKLPLAEGNRNACLVHIYPTGTGMGTRYTLGDLPTTLGRGGDCDVCINDNSVSRLHARILPTDDGYLADDLQSTNGTFVNDVPASMYKLHDGDYLRVGNCIYRFLMGGNVEAEYHEEIYRLTIIDALTDIPNSRALLEFLDRELARSCRHNRPLALVMIDVDRFKLINDELGHLGGDYALRELAGRLKGNIRKEELFARYGGEEFAIVLPETNREAALELCERMRLLIAAEPFRYEDKAFQVTISLGVATTSGEPNLTPKDLIALADEKLYAAKHQGRNRVVG
jgi:two-component system, cell cycle response regulator